MFMVGGGILTHGIPALHEPIEHAAHAAGTIPGIGGLLEALTPVLLSALAGIIAGAVVLAGVTIASRIFRKTKAHT
jgi:predicted DNA repair protein MutK